jgi:hypothetical protein
MSNNELVSNSYLSNNPDIRPRSIEKTTAPNPDPALTQVVSLDIGGTGAESLVTGANPMPITGTVTAVPTDDLSVTGLSITTVNQSIAGPTINGRSSISWQITGTWTGIIAFEKRIDASTWMPMGFYTQDISGGTAVVETSQNGIFFSSIGSTQAVRIRSISWVSGTATISGSSSYGIKAVNLNGQLPAGSNNIGKVSIEEAGGILERLYEILSLMPFPDVAGRMRVNIETGTVTTVTTVTTVRDIGSNTASVFNAGKQSWDLGDIAEAVGVRAFIRTW